MKKILTLLASTLVLFVAGCSGSSEDDDSTSPPASTETAAPEPTATQEPEPTATQEPEPTATQEPEPTPSSTPVDDGLLGWDMTLVDFLTLKPLSGAQVTVGDVIATTDDAGKVSFRVEPNSIHTASVSARGYLDTEFVRHFDTFGWTTTSAVLSNMAVSALSASLGITYDSEAAILEVALVAPTTYPSFEQVVYNTTVDLDVEYETALVSDKTSPSGFAVGNTTLDGSLSGVYFINVAPGTTQLDIQPPDSYVCEDYIDSAELRAGGYSSVVIVCEAL